jgi:hypothetical protein
MDRTLALPASILIGSLIIAVGLFLGLQNRSPPPSNPEQPPPRVAATVPTPRLPVTTGSPGGAPVTTGSPGGAPDEGAAPSPPVAAPDELNATATKQAAEALLAQHGDLVKKCWEPSFKANPEPAKAKYTYNLAFGADGKEIARGISDVRGMERSDVGQCLRAQPATLRIPPPGVVVSDVNLTLTLP